MIIIFSFFNWVSRLKNFKQHPHMNILGIDIDDNVRTDPIPSSSVQQLLSDIDKLGIECDDVKLSADTREVAAQIAGYIAKKLKKKKSHACCREHLIGKMTDWNDDHSYIVT